MFTAAESNDQAGLFHRAIARTAHKTTPPPANELAGEGDEQN